MTKSKELPSQVFLNELFRYEPETVFLSWKVSKASAARIGGKVGCINENGYLRVTIDYVSYTVHRIIYKMTHGVDPIHIDHINGVRDDNRIENLRSVTVSENSRNQKKSKANTSGHTGVYRCRRSNKWYTQITINFKTKTLGYFHDKQDAIKARKQAEIKYGFHKNHGRD